MQKWGVLIIVVLLAAVLGFQRFMKKNEPMSQPAQSSGQSDQVGVALPSGSAASPEASAYVPGQKPLTNCAAKSAEQILSEKSELWDYSSKNTTFTAEQRKKIYGVMGNYLVCRAVGLDNLSGCKSLANNSGKSDLTTPDSRCKDNANTVLFYAYMAGRYKNKDACSLFLKGESMKGAKVNVDDFCAAAARGMDGVCPGIKKSLSDKDYGKCRTLFPAAASDCGSDQTCLSSLKLYAAIKSGSSADCPPEYAGTCEAYLTQKTAPCSVYAQELTKVYCPVLEEQKYNEMNAALAGKAGKEAHLAKEAALAKDSAIAKEAAAMAKKNENFKDTQSELMKEETNKVNARVKKMLHKD